MKHHLSLLLCLILPTLALGKTSEKEPRLSKGDMVYAILPVVWPISKDVKLGHFKQLPKDQMECTDSDYRYVVPACDPLYVMQQTRKRTWVAPGDENIRWLFTPKRRKAWRFHLRAPIGLSARIDIPGGRSSKVDRVWFVSREECLDWVSKQEESKKDEKVEGE